MLEERSGVAVDRAIRVRRSAPRARQPLCELRAPALEERQTVGTVQVAAERQLQGEAALVVGLLGGEQVDEHRPAVLRDPVCLPGTTRRSGQSAQPGRRQLAVERAGRDEARQAGARRRATVRDLLDRARLLQPLERRIQRAERDAPERAERLGEALLQLVAVQRLFGQQAEDRELQHDASPRGEEEGTAREAPSRTSSTIYRIDISKQALSVRFVPARAREMDRARPYTFRRCIPSPTTPWP